ncbi:peptidoglycan editing factor PgeF [Pseudoduganella armeniaca]|uniref:Purine nucleoside phosphorylase n=1 Tax=Pseudoduganella armeniaca TaxID=2072590 RepID=A0A2R4CAS4_9BURK|nr:peptidoglycan editing factor PgeF [Pseudoduganella armeniaca]AVR96695.1 peptidoglycan editing factor PgeF [Pseudoduganella armeniaca]
MSKTPNAPQWLVPDWPDLPASVGVLCTTRRGGVSPPPYDDGQGRGGLNLGTHVGDSPKCVERNRDIVRAELPSEPVWLAQVHGTTIVDAGTVDTIAGVTPTADASFTRERGVVCAILTADCLPVLLCDAAGGAVGAVHAGWRGLAEGVLEQSVAAMRAAGAGELRAWLGAAIGPAKFEVGVEVLEAFLARAGGDADLVRGAFLPVAERPGKYLCNLYALARIALARVGVHRIAGGDFCTVSNSGRFYSFRRDGITGRQASLIWIR